MNRPVIFILTKEVGVYHAFKNKLKEIFGQGIQLASNHFPPVDMNEVDLVLSSGSYEIYTEYLGTGIKNVPLIIANRSIDFNKLEQLLDIPADTKCLLVSNETHIARDSVELFKRLGFDQLALTAYSPDMNPLPELEGFDVAITHGLTELVPPKVKKVVDLGDRNLDLSTIFEIARTLELSIDKPHLYTMDYFRNFVRIGRELATSIQNEKFLNTHLETVLDAVHEGIIWVNANGTITVFNEEASNILGIKGSNVIGRHYSEVIRDLNIDDVMDTKREIPREIIQVQGQHILITKTPNFLDGEFAGAVVTFQDVSHVQRMEQEIRKKKTESGLTTKYSFDDIVGKSEIIEQTKNLSKKIARSEYTILISGESGTGKEVFAQAIHDYSSRKKGPFLAVNFAGITQTLAESELFGYEEGAFTGAMRGGKAGLFELAQNGTIFLDEIGDAPPNIQAAILRVIQEREVMRVGGSKVIPINVRIIAATNKDIHQMISEGEFREDLFYRLNQLPLDIPPLRERQQDIKVLINHLLDERNIKLSLTAEMLETITNYNWPGNIRELEGLVNYLTVVADGVHAGVEHLPLSMKPRTTDESEVNFAINYLEDQGDLILFKKILYSLLMYKNQNSGIGRQTIISILDVPISEGKLRVKIDALRKCGCVYSGTKKQGTKITELGSKVLEHI
ncbi:sigma-54 interaction domain-containing protein [Virgibacillus sp. JSM 102003]|uniref:sigma-54 interaction domain-containing protein n=1 Tax=Virgibacillus sp. JSM 102003 TaxID=1562108 RepID=UPI0035C1F926